VPEPGRSVFANLAGATDGEWRAMPADDVLDGTSRPGAASASAFRETVRPSVRRRRTPRRRALFAVAVGTIQVTAGISTGAEATVTPSGATTASRFGSPRGPTCTACLPPALRRRASGARLGRRAVPFVLKRLRFRSLTGRLSRPDDEAGILLRSARAACGGAQIGLPWRRSAPSDTARSTRELEHDECCFAPGRHGVPARPVDQFTGTTATASTSEPRRLPPRLQVAARGRLRQAEHDRIVVFADYCARAGARFTCDVPFCCSRRAHVKELQASSRPESQGLRLTPGSGRRARSERRPLRRRRLRGVLVLLDVAQVVLPDLVVERDAVDVEIRAPA